MTGTPVFVGGLNRSGTTLAARILGSHSALAVPSSEFLFFGKGAAHEPEDRAEFERRLHEILDWPRVREWGLDASRVLETSRRWPATARSLFLLPLDEYRRLLGKDRLGEKSVLNELRLDAFEEWFADYRFVHMVRDPVTAYASGHSGGPRSVRQAVRWGRLWVASTELGLRSECTHPDRRRLVRYEDLTAEPAATVTALCEFLGLEPELGSMLDLAAYDEKENSSFAASSEGDYEGAVRRSDGVDRRAAVSPRERAALAAVCGAVAGQLGYELERRISPVALSAIAAERIQPRRRLRSALCSRVRRAKA